MRSAEAAIEFNSLTYVTTAKKRLGFAAVIKKTKLENGRDNKEIFTESSTRLNVVLPKVLHPLFFNRTDVEGHTFPLLKCLPKCSIFERTASPVVSSVFR